MKNLNLVRGLLLMAFALTFGMASFKYNIGAFSRAGPGLFPLLMSSVILLIGLASVVRSRFVAPIPLHYDLKNITFVLLSLCGFAVFSKYLDMVVGIVFLVFCASFAGKSYSVTRNLKISAGLIAIALMFKHLLGLNLPMF